MTAALYYRTFNDDDTDADPLFLAGFADLPAVHRELDRLRAAGVDVESNHLVLEGGEWLTPQGVALRLGLAPSADETSADETPADAPADEPADEPETLADRWPALAIGWMEGGSYGLEGIVFPSRLVLSCSGSPLPWGPLPEELRDYPRFGIEMLFN